MNEIKVTFELCAEDRKRLDDVLEGLVSRCDSCVELMAQAPVKAEEQSDRNEQVTSKLDASCQQVTGKLEEAEEPAPALESQEEAPTVKREDIQKLVVTLSAAGKKDQVREIVKAYADKVSTVPENKLHEVFMRLSALQEG